MPQMGVSVAEGTVVEWRRRPATGRARRGHRLDLDRQDRHRRGGARRRVLAEILVEVGTTVDVGIVLARIATDAGPARRGDGGRRRRTSRRRRSRWRSPGGRCLRAAPPEAAGDRPSRRHAAPRAGNGARRYSPVVMRIAAEHDIDLERSTGTGRGGACASRTCSPPRGGRRRGGEEPPMHIESPYRPDAPSAPRARRSRWADEPAAARLRAAPASTATRRRRERAAVAHAPDDRRAMLHSLQTAATCTTIVEADLYRDRGRAQATRADRAAVRGPRDDRDAARVPVAQRHARGRDFTELRRVHLGIAVSLGKGGLIVPVIRDAQDLGGRGAGRAHQGHRRAGARRTLTPDDVRGGTFTITNPGGYGSIMATPVINQPQVAILDPEATSSGRSSSPTSDGNDSIAIRADGLPLHVVGPPGAGRRAGGGVPRPRRGSGSRAAPTSTPRGAADGH